MHDDDFTSNNVDSPPSQAATTLTCSTSMDLTEACLCHVVVIVHPSLTSPPLIDIQHGELKHRHGHCTDATWLRLPPLTRPSLIHSRLGRAAQRTRRHWGDRSYSQPQWLSMSVLYCCVYVNKKKRSCMPKYVKKGGIQFTKMIEKEK